MRPAWQALAGKLLPVPIFLSLGFVAWAACFTTLGVGYFHLELEQYAVAAFLTAVNGIAAIFVACAAAIISAKATRKVKLSVSDQGLRASRIALWSTVAILALGVSALAYESHLPFVLPSWLVFATFLLLLLVAALRGFVHDARAGRPARAVWRTLYGLVVLVSVPLSFVALGKMQNLALSGTEFVMGSVFYLIPGLYLALVPPMAPPVPPTRGKNPWRTTAWSWEKKPPLVVWRREGILSSAMTMLVVAAVVGGIVLPNFPQQLGGAATRDAVLVMDPSAFDNATRSILFSAEDRHKTAPTRSTNLTVVFQNPEWFFVRPAAATAGGYQIARDEVRTIVWIS